MGVMSCTEVIGHAADNRGRGASLYLRRTGPCPRQDSNLHLLFRREPLYPLNYGGQASDQDLCLQPHTKLAGRALASALAVDGGVDVGGEGSEQVVLVLARPAAAGDDA